MTDRSWELVAERPPEPQPDELTQFFWDGISQHQLLIQRCRNCLQYNHPPLPHCRFCLSTELTPTEVSGRGVLDSFIIVMEPGHPYFLSRVPYNLSVVELAEQQGLKMVSQVVDCENDDLRFAMPLVVTFREVVPGMILPLFVPA
jgi:uncharacterized OB-fold protein